jgi:hypothetical protein
VIIIIVDILAAIKIDIYIAPTTKIELFFDNYTMEEVACCLVGIGAAWYMYMTKPTDHSFKKFIKEKTKLAGQNWATSKIASICVDKICTIEIKDYVFIKIGMIQLGDKKEYYVGSVQNWFLASQV